MKIVVTTEGDSLASAVDPRFGRAARFLLYDTESQSCESIDNARNLRLAQGAGVQAAAMIAQLGAQVVITGHCGPKTFQTLVAAGVQVVMNATGTVEQVIKQFQQGQLQPASTANVAGHW